MEQKINDVIKMDSSYVMLYIIVDDGKGSKAMSLIKANGAKGGTIMLARGTAPGKILKFLGIQDVRKEILTTVVSNDEATAIILACDDELKLSKPGHGIAFCVPISNIFGTHFSYDENDSENKEGAKMDNAAGYDLIYTIIEHGYADDVVEATRQAGAKGGTIMSGRGSTGPENLKFFGITIEPERDIILTLISKDKTEAVINAINEKLDFDTPGRGIAFVMNVSRTAGISGNS